MSEFINIVIAVAAQIVLPLSLAIAATDDVDEYVQGFQRVGSPAKKIERCVVLAAGGDLCKVLGLRLGIEMDPHADARKHRANRLADCSIIDVAIIGAIHL